MNWLHQPGGPIGDRSIEEMDKWLSFGNVIRESWGYAVFYGILTVISIVPFAVVMLMLLFLDESITGKVTDVIDGDTIKVGYMKIEFDGVWVPDLSNPLGKQAKKSMNQLVAGIQVTCKLTNTKSKQHRFGTCFLPDKTNLSAEIISSGLARDCPRHSGGRYQKFETEKNKRLSLPDYC